MARIRSSHLVLASACLALLAACGGAGAPAGDAPPEIKERVDNFKAIGKSFKAIRGQIEGGSPDFAAIASSAKDINARAEKITGLFPKGTSVEDGFDTEALPAIWEKPDDFKAAAQKLIDESAKLAELAAGGDAAAVGEQAEAMGGACKGCHDKFREEDE